MKFHFIHEVKMFDGINESFLFPHTCKLNFISHCFLSAYFDNLYDMSDKIVRQTDNFNLFLHLLLIAIECIIPEMIDEKSFEIN